MPKVLSFSSLIVDEGVAIVVEMESKETLPTAQEPQPKKKSKLLWMMLIRISYGYTSIGELVLYIQGFFTVTLFLRLAFCPRK